MDFLNVTFNAVSTRNRLPVASIMLVIKAEISDSDILKSGQTKPKLVGKTFHLNLFIVYELYLEPVLQDRGIIMFHVLVRTVVCQLFTC